MGEREEGIGKGERDEVGEWVGGVGGGRLQRERGSG